MWGLLALCLLIGCSPDAGQCTAQSDCFAGERCIDRVCVSQADAHGAPGERDARTPHAAGDAHPAADADTDAACVGASCRGCVYDGDCAHLPDTPVCHEQTCVECTAEKRDHCAGSSCDPATNQCTRTPDASVLDCGACVADSECKEHGSRCVPMEFRGAQLKSGYCLPLYADPGCPRQFPNRVNRPTLSGSPTQAFCAPNEQKTTCAAIFDKGMQCEANNDCGLRNYQDGVCKAGTCTIQCDENKDCAHREECVGSIYCKPCGDDPLCFDY